MKSSQSPTPYSVQRIARVNFQAATPQLASAWLANEAPGLQQGVHIHLANAYTLALADKDPGYRAVLSQSEALNFPDGKPLSVLSQLRRDDPPLEQVRGPQFMLDVINRSQYSGARHYFLGSTPEVLQSMIDRFARDYPAAQIAGHESPPFRALSPAERMEQRDRIMSSGADIVWVGLGTPKQDWEAAALAEDLPVAAVAVGAAFDFAAGRLKLAPEWMSATGLEWLHRLLAEPRRLWRRYLFGNARFLASAVRHGRR